MNDQQSLEPVKDFVLAFFDLHPDKRLVYHNRAHTRAVVANVAQIAHHYQLNNDDFFAVCAAAWFHDTGYVFGQAGHENRSVEIANDFFNGTQVPEDVINKIKDCILATRMPQQPANNLECMICDADLFHLGTADFTRCSKLMREEAIALSGKEIKKDAWRQKNIQLLEHHHFHTDYCRLLLEEKKQKNLEELKNKQKPAKGKKGEAPHITEPVTDYMDMNQVSKTKERLSKGVETMFRITASGQQRLSDMADSKAHIMISVNAIIISLVISLLLRKISDEMSQLIPAICLLIVNLVTIVFSILATRPNVAQGTFTRQDVASRNVNLLFFGNFFKMNLPDYTDSMLDMINDKDFLYRSMVRDLHAQGIVLARKYFLLRISYSVFMYGLIVSVIAFIISSLM